MQHRDTLQTAAKILTERQGEYGSPGECFTRIANIASEILMRRVSRYEVATILLATKLGRAGESALKEDTWIDALNYAAFAGEFAQDADAPPISKVPGPEAPRTPTFPVRPPRAVSLGRQDQLSAAVHEAFDKLDTEE